jgi:hypothetical protein
MDGGSRFPTNGRFSRTNRASAPVKTVPNQEHQRRAYGEHDRDREQAEGEAVRGVVDRAEQVRADKAARVAPVAKGSDTVAI